MSYTYTGLRGCMCLYLRNDLNWQRRTDLCSFLTSEIGMVNNIRTAKNPERLTQMVKNVREFNYICQIYENRMPTMTGISLKRP